MLLRRDDRFDSLNLNESNEINNHLILYSQKDALPSFEVRVPSTNPRLCIQMYILPMPETGIYSIKISDIKESLKRRIFEYPKILY